MERTKTLVIATRNRKKEKELNELLGGSGWEIRSLADWPEVPEVLEDGNTFLENARKKAIEVSTATGETALADDSGLAVDALDGAPGIYSARYSATEGKLATDQGNIERLLQELKDVPDENRTARFVCAVVIAEKGEVLFETEQTVEGMITHEPRGTGGFGYDPVFFYPPFNATFGEVPIEEKHTVSHRSKALGEVKKWAQNLAIQGE